MVLNTKKRIEYIDQYGDYHRFVILNIYVGWSSVPLLYVTFNLDPIYFTLYFKYTEGVFVIIVSKPSYYFPYWAAFWVVDWNAQCKT